VAQRVDSVSVAVDGAAPTATGVQTWPFNAPTWAPIRSVGAETTSDDRPGRKAQMKAKTIARARWATTLLCLLPMLAVAQAVAPAASDESVLFGEIPTVYGVSRYE